MSIKLPIMLATTVIAPTLSCKIYEYLIPKPDAKKNQEIIEWEQNKSLVMIGVAVALIVFGISMSVTMGCNAVSMGIAISGLLLLIRNVIYNWSTFGIERQILVLASSLLILTYIGTKREIVFASYFC